MGSTLFKISLAVSKRFKPIISHCAWHIGSDPAKKRSTVMFIQTCAYTLCTAVQYNSIDPSTVPVARSSACETAWYRWERPVVVERGVVPVLPFQCWYLPAGTYRHYF